MLLTRWLKLAPVLFVAVAATAGSGLLAHNGGAAAEPQPQDKPQAARAGDMPVTVVKPDRLRVTVSERGSLESSYNLDVFCKVEGQTTIIFIVPEGSRVTKGQIVCELDSAALKDQLINQEITMKAAEAAYRRAKFAREIAEIALVEYKEGIYVHDRETVMGQLGVTKSKLQKAKDRLDRTRRARRRLDEMLAAKREPATSTAIVAELDIDDRIDDAEQAVMRETLALEEAQTKLNVLEKFTKDKTIKELQSDVEQKRADELARQATWELEMAKQKKLITQIQNCVIKAPGDGMVVYANDPNRFGGQPRAQIEEGATVRERQKIFSVPDLKRFQVNAKVHESIVDRVTPGQTARIEVDAFPGVTLTGKVRDVAPLPDPSTFFNADVKVYSSKVTIDNPLPGLRPGMTARVVILVAEREDVISVPISAILHYDDKDHVAVKKPDGEFDWREVTLGISDDKVVEVKQGLRSGEAVALSPVALMSEEEKREKLGKPTPPAGRTPATGAAGQAKAKGKAQRPGLPPSLRAKLQNMAPEERRALFTASPEERKTALRKAGFNDDEIKQFEQLRQGSGGGRGPAAPDGRRP